MNAVTDTFSDLVWIQTAFLGDIVLTTAAVDLVRRELPGVRQHIITTPLGVRALAGLDGVTSLIPFDKRNGSLGAFRSVKRELRSHLPRGSRPVVLQAHRSYRSSFLARYLNVPTVTYDETSLGGHAFARVARVATLHEAARIGLLLEPLGVSRRDIVQARPHLSPLPLDGDSAWQDRLRHWQGPVIAIAPGSVWGTKRWTSESFEALGRRLLEDPTIRLVLLGSEAEAPLTAAIAAALAAPDRVLDLAGRTSLDDLRRIYPHLALLVTNDSSPVHYASAFNTPTVAIFGATVPAMGFGPLADRSATPGVTLPCRPCSDHGPETCPLGHFKCMRDLSPTTVHAEVLRILVR